MRRLWILAVLMAAVGLLAAPGCSKRQGRKVVPVNGRVLYNGEPLGDAMVTFSNAEANIAAYGQSGANGRFKLTTFEHGDGAVPGKHRVSVRRVQIINPNPLGFDPFTDGPAKPVTEVWLIPKRYGSLQTSKLTVDVAEEGKNDIVIELEGKPTTGASDAKKTTTR